MLCYNKQQYGLDRCNQDYADIYYAIVYMQSIAWIII